MGLSRGVFQILINLIDYNVGDLGTVTAPVNLTRGKSFGDGTGADQADTKFSDNRTLADGANETINLNDGSLTDSHGVALTLDILKGIYIKNNSADASLLVGGGGANSVGLFNDVTDIAVIPPGGELFMTFPDGTGLDLTSNADLKLEHDGTGSDSLTYDIVAIGVD